MKLLPLDRMRQDRQTPALHIGQRHLFPLQFRFQDAMFLAEILDDVILMAIDSGRKPSDQEL